VEALCVFKVFGDAGVDELELASPSWSCSRASDIREHNSSMMFAFVPLMSLRISGAVRVM